VPPTALNSGQNVCLLPAALRRHFDMRDFDDLPTPFRTVAVDLPGAAGRHAKWLAG
jgi:hypothetical protein